MRSSVLSTRLKLTTAARRSCTAILYIPYALIIPSSAASTATPSLLDLKHPILDLSTTSTTSAFYLSLDLSKSPDSTDSPIRHVAAIEHALVLSPLSPLESLLSSSAVPRTSSPFAPPALANPLTSDRLPPPPLP